MMENNPTIAVENALHEAADKVEKALTGYLSEEMIGNTATAEAMRYSTLGGGKEYARFWFSSFASCSVDVKKLQCRMPAHSNAFTHTLSYMTTCLVWTTTS